MASNSCGAIDGARLPPAEMPPRRGGSAPYVHTARHAQTTPPPSARAFGRRLACHDQIKLAETACQVECDSYAAPR